MSRVRTIYYDHARDAALQPAFPRGEAGPVTIAADGEWTAETRVWIGPNSHCALVHHGVGAALAALRGAQGRLGGGSDLLLPPSAAESVARLFYEADRRTYGASYDFLVLTRQAPEPIHYRVAIDNREYQKTLSQLQYLATTAARYGHGLRIRL